MIRTGIRLVLAIVALIVGVICAAGCGGPAAPTGTVPTTTTSVVAPPPPPGHLALVGAVKRQRADLTIDQLKTMPMQTVSATFGTSKGSETHVEAGVPVIALVNDAGLAIDGARKHDELNFAVLVVGADGYSALLSYGELAPETGNRQVLLALTQDNVALTRPRVVVVGDVMGSRYVSDVVKLQVVRVGP